MPKLKRPYTYAWIAWLVAFVVIEGIAIAKDGSGDTLSSHVWHVLDQGTIWYYVLGAFLTWLTPSNVHFL